MKTGITDSIANTANDICRATEPDATKPSTRASSRPEAGGALSALLFARARPRRVAAVEHGQSPIGPIGTRATKKRIERAYEVFHTLIDESSNRKPRLGADETWVTDLLDRMKAGNYVTQNGAEYVHTDGADTGGIHTRWTEFAGDTSDAAQAAKRSFPDLAIAVPGFRGRKPDEPRRLAQLGAADAIVLAEGDLHAPYQIIETLRLLRSGDVKNTPLVVPRAVLNFYQPLWKALFGAAPTGTSVHDFYGKQLQQWIRSGKRSDRKAVVLTPQSLDAVSSENIRAVTRATQASTFARAAHGDQLAINELVVPQLYVSTTKEEKAAHWRANINGKDVEVRLLMEAIDILGEPEERHRSYMANARGSIAGELAKLAKSSRYPWAFGRLSTRAPSPAPRTDQTVNTGKAQANIETIQQVLSGKHSKLSRDDFLQRLKSQGVDVAHNDKLYFISDDRGFEFPEWSKIEPYFDKQTKEAALALIRKNVGGQSPKLQAVPGVESTWWINAAGGVEQLMNHCMNAFDAYENETGEKLSRKVTSVVATTLVEMDLATGRFSARNFSGASTYDCRKPAGEMRADTTECWFVPTDGNPGGHSIQQFMDGEDGVPDFKRLLPWVKAGRAMEADGIVFHNARGKKRVADYRIDFVGANSGRGTALQRQMDEHVKEGLGAFQSEKTAAARAPDETYSEMFVGFNFSPYGILERVDRSDAIVFDSVPTSTSGQAQLFYDYFSTLVFKSLHPDYAGMQVLVNRNDPQLKILGSLVDTQHRYGLSQELFTMAKSYTDETDARACLKQHWNGYERVRLAAQSRKPEVPFDLDGALAAGRKSVPPSVVVLASGKAEQPALVAQAKAVAEWIVASGLDARTGGGAKGLMGAVGKQFKLAADRIGNGARIAGISTEMVIGKETAKNELPKELDVPYVTHDIVSRMVLLFGADMGIFLAGGIGTAQEIAFAIALKAVGHPLTKDKPMVLLNPRMPDRQRLADGYMAFFGAADKSLRTSDERIAAGRQILRQMGVHVVEVGQDDAEAVIKRECERIAAESGVRLLDVASMAADADSRTETSLG